ncbi:MAG: sensor histidine kinase [Bacteroidetes bacterium]|nr:sensor histidine kinase [Bacteroidota bacterium]
MERQRFEAGIELGELFRKTGDYEKGLEQLQSLGNGNAYPELQVRRLGRIAAIYDEWHNPNLLHRDDSVFTYLDSALHLSGRVHLPAEEASLYNQLGYRMYSDDHEKGLAYLLHAAQLFESLRDTHNYVGAMTNVLRCYMSLQDSLHAGLIISELVPLIKDRKWHTAEIELYRIAASYALNFSKDSVAAQQWSAMADRSHIANLEAINSAQVNAFRTLYETRQLHDRLSMQQQALDRESRRTRDLILFSLLLTTLIVVVIALLLRERTLRRRLKSVNLDLQVSNEKYRLLMIESNHRIKNNLQMVISLLHYSKTEMQHDTSAAFQRMAQKIRTIGALHEHLSADEHNEFVALDKYFVAIAGLYADIAADFPAVRCTIEPAPIRSERIVYFGLILNEMLANTIEHRTGQTGDIQVEVVKLGDRYRFDYRDNSVHNPLTAKGTGSRLIRGLVDRIGGTEFNVNLSNGHYQFYFHG